ncbi:hypothetical protein HPB48_011101 [Haemaphysalis longicornis]|uniref:Uncharacterized protein n=1 Tax=Haemaphysalis longicornis TaxID=44386 RepID=A0A9J6GCA7_HAELO|nr:hypothetical protein HPB48_011101 [Haemaphysalis longicornis]
MTPVGKCTARITMADADFVVSFVVLAECCNVLLLGRDFLKESNAAIDVGERLITLSSSHRLPELTACRAPLRVIDEGVNIPPRSCMRVSVHCDMCTTVDGIADRIGELLFRHGIALARGVLHVTDGRAELLLSERNHFMSIYTNYKVGASSFGERHSWYPFPPETSRGCEGLA